MTIRLFVRKYVLFVTYPCIGYSVYSMWQLVDHQERDKSAFRSVDTHLAHLDSDRWPHVTSLPLERGN